MPGDPSQYMSGHDSQYVTIFDTHQRSHNIHVFWLILNTSDMICNKD